MARTWTVLAIVACALAAGAPAAGAQTIDPFATCRSRFAQAPDDYDSAYCFYEVTFAQQRWDEGGRVFERLMAQHPENFWLPMAAGHVYRTRDPERAEALYRRAGDGFQRTGHAEGEILARSNLRNFLFPKDGRAADAAAEIRRIASLATTVADPVVKARAWVAQATHVSETGEDLGFAYRLLKQAADVVFPDGPYRLQRTCLIALGGVAYHMGRLDEALSIFSELETLAAREGELPVQANARYNLLMTAMLKERLLPTAGAAPELLRLAERSLETAIAAQNQDITLKTHRAIAELLAIDPGTRAGTLDHVARCIDLAVATAQPDDEAVCSWIQASLLRGHDPAGATAAERRAADADVRASSPITHAYTTGRRMRLSWDSHSRELAIEDSLRAIDAIETLRSLQDTAASGAELLSTWTSHYYWFSGRLLQDARAADLDLAFSITERMRARALLDTLDRSRTPPPLRASATADLRALRGRIAAVQRRLLDPALDGRARRDLLAQLDRLELDEREAGRQAALTSTSGRDGAPTFASLADLQSALAPNEALLSFQVGLWTAFDGTFGGGSWVAAITRDGKSVHRIPDRVQLAPMVPVFTGLLERGDSRERPAAVRLYRELLADALAALPPGIDRLILVPDGALHHLPFEVLRPTPEAPPLAVEYEFVVVPSATLWLHWRQAPRRVTMRALAFADPALQVSGAADAPLRNAALQQGLRLGRLPYARRESRAIARHVGAVDALDGARASERALKEADLRQYGILHLAVHAIADETHPERSAVLLAAGHDDEDGLLQAREIEALDFEGGIVVLSACQTASGAVLSGEGVLSLARAFFSAGAVSAIGNRWPIRDEDAALLFDAFYRAVGDGASLSAALQQARLAAIAAGRPPAVWASLVLLGNGDVRLLPEGTSPASPTARRAAAAAVIAMAILAAVVLARPARRRWLRSGRLRG